MNVPWLYNLHNDDHDEQTYILKLEEGNDNSYILKMLSFAKIKKWKYDANYIYLMHYSHNIWITFISSIGHYENSDQQ